MGMDVDQPRRDVAPGHVDDLGARAQLTRSDDADDLAALDDDGLVAGDPIGQNERAARERNTAL
jgi:hypothetical protein